MTQEDKGLLLKDLSARLLYGVKFKIGNYSDYKLIGVVITDEHQIKVELIENEIPYKIEVSPDIIKTYLRPMSSMTEKEKKEFDDFCVIDEFAWKGNSEIGYKNQAIIMSDAINWLNAHHFDYRGLIEKDLAIEVTEENNPYKE